MKSSTLGCLALSALALACLKDGGVTMPTASPLAHLGLRAQVTAPAGSALDVRAIYYDKAGAGVTAVTLSDSVFTITGGTQTVALKINLTSCLADQARVVQTDTACAIGVVARLLLSGSTTDSAQLPPVLVAPGGTLQEPSAITLATGKIWVGGAAGAPTDWSTAANWSPASLPVPGSTVTIPATANTPVLSSNVTVDTLKITGAGSDVRLNGHHLRVTGAVSVANGATFTMTNAADTATIGGSATFAGGSEQGRLTAGVLSVGGSFTGASPAFTASGTLQVVATGPGVWAADTIPSLTASGSGATITTTNPAAGHHVTVGRLALANGASLTAYNGIVPVLTVLAALNTASGTTITVDSLTLKNPSALDSVLGIYSALYTILDPHPTKAVAISPKLTYQQMIVTDSAVATFTGATTFAGAQANLTVTHSASVDINGQIVTLTNSNPNASTTDVILTQIGGTVISRNATGSVTVTAGRVNFGTSEDGLLTAGTFVVGNYFTDGAGHSLPATFHIVMTGGTTASPGVVICDTVGSVSLTNTALTSIQPSHLPFAIVQNLVVGSGATLWGTMALVGTSTFASGAQVTNASIRVATTSPFAPQGNFSPLNLYFALPGTPLTIPGGITPGNLYVRGAGTTASLTGTVSAGAVYVDSGSSLNLNSHTLTIGNAGLNIQNGGTLVMTSPADTLTTGGNATFTGGNETGLMTAGVLNVGTGIISNGGTTFLPGGSLTTVCGSPGHAGIVLLNGAFHFQNLQVVNSCRMGADTAYGSFLAQPGTGGAPPALTPINSPEIEVVGINVTALNDSGVAIHVQGLGVQPAGTVTSFQNVTFKGLATAPSQLSLDLAPGTTLTLTNITFSPMPTGAVGRYLVVNNVGGAGSAAVTVNVSHDPGNGAAQTTVSGGPVVVNWSP